MNEPLVSICVPVYEMNDKGVEYLDVLMQSTSTQTYKNFEVIISDHSKNNDILNYLDSMFWKKRLNLTYVKYEEKYKNGPANTNNTLKYANGKYIKLLFQDDFFNGDTALDDYVQSLETSDYKWCVSECIHCNTNTNVRFHHFKPRWNLESPFTIETYFQSFPRLGAPSLIMFEFNKKLFFNEDVVMYMDVDFYYKLGKVYGTPRIIDKQLIVDRDWPGNIGNSVGRHVDLNYEKHKMIELYKNNEYSFDL